jgi:hypothetical protein
VEREKGTPSSFLKFSRTLTGERKRTPSNIPKLSKTLAGGGQADCYDVVEAVTFLEATGLFWADIDVAFGEFDWVSTFSELPGRLRGCGAAWR